MTTFQEQTQEEMDINTKFGLMFMAKSFVKERTKLREEEEELEICPSCGDEWTEATRCDCPEQLPLTADIIREKISNWLKPDYEDSDEEEEEEEEETKKKEQWALLAGEYEYWFEEKWNVQVKDSPNYPNLEEELDDYAEWLVAKDYKDVLERMEAITHWFGNWTYEEWFQRRTI